MHPDRLKWNRKHHLTGPGLRPSKAVAQYVHLARCGRALDIAAGNGRNALFLAARGFAVDAVDISDVGLRLFAGKHGSIFAFCANLETYRIASDRYSLIININYLNRRLFPYIQNGLVPGGLLIFETFLDRPGFQSPKPFSPENLAHLLKPGELATAFPELTPLVCRETDEPAPADPYPSALLVAVKGGADFLPENSEYLSSTGPSPGDSRCGCKRT
jgi:SAM-dependent methyltransferase